MFQVGVVIGCIVVQKTIIEAISCDDNDNRVLCRNNVKRMMARIIKQRPKDSFST